MFYKIMEYKKQYIRYINIITNIDEKISNYYNKSKDKINNNNVENNNNNDMILNKENKCKKKLQE
jgi:hypothetical protein